MRFFIQYNAKNKPPKLLNIRFNGKEICTAKTVRDTSKIDITTTTTASSVVNTSRINERLQTTQKPTQKYWIQATRENSPVKAEDKTKQTTVRPSIWNHAFFQVANDAKKPVDKLSSQVLNNKPVSTKPKEQAQTITETKTQPIPAAYIRPLESETKEKPLPVIDNWPNRNPVKGKRPPITFVLSNEGATPDQEDKDQPIYERPKSQDQSGNRQIVQTEASYTVPAKTQEDDIVGKWPEEQPSRWTDVNNGRVTLESAVDRPK